MIEYIKIFVMALINGIAMPLPISSSAHVSFINKVLNYTESGNILSFYYAVFSIAFSLVIFFNLRKIYSKVLKSFFAKNNSDKFASTYKKAGKNILFSLLPAALLYIPVSKDMLLVDYFDKFLSSSGLLLAAFASLISALVFVTAIWYTKQNNAPTLRNASTKTVIRSAIYELVAFVVPGTSKIAIGSVNMLICDVEPKVIMREIYLYSAPVIFVVGVVKIIRGLVVDLVVDPLAIIIGAVVSVIASAIIVFFVSKVNMRKLMGFFAWYTAIFGVSAFIMSLI